MIIDSYAHCPAPHARRTAGAAPRAHYRTLIAVPASSAGRPAVGRRAVRQEGRQ
ncbi:protein of unknown function [Burkholderia multivorans]